MWMNDLMVVSLLFGNLMHSVYMTPASCDSASFVKREIRAAISLYNLNSSLGVGSTTKHSPDVPAIPEPPENSSCSGNLDVSNRDTPVVEKDFAEDGPVTRRHFNTFSSITMSSSVSRKSVSWGMAYYSEGGDIESGMWFLLPFLSKTTIMNLNQRMTAIDRIDSARKQSRVHHRGPTRDRRVRVRRQSLLKSFTRVQSCKKGGVLL